MNSWSLAWQAALEAWRHPRNPLSWIRQPGLERRFQISAQSDALCLDDDLICRLPRCALPFQSEKGHWKFGHTLMNLVIASVQSLRDVLFLVHGAKKVHIFCITKCLSKTARLTLLCSFGCSTWSCIQRPPNSSENLQKIPRSFAAGVQSNAEAVWLRWDKCCHGGPCNSTELCWDLDYLAVRETETWSLWCVVLRKMQYCQALSCCRQLCRSHWCCSCCGAGKCLHGCECVWQSEVGMQNSHGILLFGQVGESNRAAAEFADDNVAWSHLVTIENRWK